MGYEQTWHDTHENNQYGEGSGEKDQEKARRRAANLEAARALEALKPTHPAPTSEKSGESEKDQLDLFN